MTSRPFDFSQAAADWVTILPDLGTLPSPGDVLTAGAIAGTTVKTKFGPAGGTVSGVSSFNTRTGVVTLTSGDVTTALTFTPYNATNPASYQTDTNVATALVPYARLASPVFSGDPTAPTPSPGDRDTSIATTAFVANSFAPIASPVFTGNPQAPTPSLGDADNSIATTAFIANTLAAAPPAGAIINDVAPTAAPGALWWDSVGANLYVRYDDGNSQQWVPATPALNGAIALAQLPASVQQVPISFPFSGKPASGALVNVPMAFAVTIPASLAGSVVFTTTKATATSTFIVNRVTAAGVTTTLGTVAITGSTTTSATLSGSGGALAVSDTLQIVAPASQDTTLADCSITILAARV